MSRAPSTRATWDIHSIRGSSDSEEYGSSSVFLAVYNTRREQTLKGACISRRMRPETIGTGKLCWLGVDLSEQARNCRWPTLIDSANGKQRMHESEKSRFTHEPWQEGSHFRRCLVSLAAGRSFLRCLVAVLR